MGKLTRVLSVCLTALALLPLSAVSASAEPTITGIALDEQGRPLQNVYWEVYHWEDGEWTGLQYGPKLTDAAGRFTVGADAGVGYRVCFSDSYYGLYSDDPPAYWYPEVRHQDVCWPDAASVETAQTWTAPGDGGTTFTLTLPQEGLGMAPVDPFVVGSFEVGEPLTVVGQEGWRPTSATLSYRWWRGTDAGYDVIPGATASTYTPTAADDGAWVQAEVTATLAGYKPATLVSQVNMVGAEHAQLTAPLQITGTAAPGQTLTASFGKPTASNYSQLEWFVDGLPQPGATGYDAVSGTFAVTSAMAGATIEVRLTDYLQDPEGNYIDGSSTYARAGVQVAGSRPAQPLQVSAPPAVATAPVAGTTAVGGTLTAPVGLTADPAATTSYQWLRDAAPIAGATAPTYQLQPADIGHRISLTVTVARPGWWGTYVGTSPASEVVLGLLAPGQARIKGTARTGAKLKAKVTGWSGVTLSYQWLRNGKPIKPAKKATKATYQVTRKDRGKRITVVVTATQPFYLAATATSKAKKVKR